jgi:hypothetical protein
VKREQHKEGMELFNIYNKREREREKEREKERETMTEREK